MALIKCPECGRENVSDSAEICPDCGYGVKAHFDMLRKQQQIQKAYEMKLQSVEMPEMPKHMNASYGLAIFSLITGILSIIMLLFSGFILILFSLFFYYLGNKQYKEEMRQYNMAISNFEKYRREVIREREREERMMTSTPKCPSCGSLQTERITVVDRTVSVAAVGLASGKIGKQYRCRRCKHMW